jgi:signal transduction histidine kinase
VLSERQWRALDGVAALLGFLATAFYARSRGGGMAPAPLIVCLILLVCAPVAFRRRWPVPVLVVVTAAIAGLTVLETSMVVALSAWPLSVMLGLAGYMVAARVPRRSSIHALVWAEAVLTVVALVVWREGQGPGTPVVQSILPLAAAWFAGDGVSARQAYIAGQAEQQRTAEAERARQATRQERVRIARAVHDVVAHSLTVITVQAGLGRRLLTSRPEQAGTALESIEAIGRTAQDELRLALGLLRDDDAERAELAPAPGLADLAELAETVRAAGTPVELHTSGTDRRLSPALELSVYRIIQEALTNVVKHAPGAHATVDCAVCAREVSIEVTDDGARTGRRAGRPGSQHGIVGMRERVGAFGGSFVADEVPGHGFRVAARIPLKEGP